MFVLQSWNKKTQSFLYWQYVQEKQRNIVGVFAVIQVWMMNKTIQVSFVINVVDLFI